MKNLVNFHYSTQSLKSCTLMSFFCQNHMIFQLEILEEIYATILKGNAKFKEKLTCANLWLEKGLNKFG